MIASLASRRLTSATKLPPQTARPEGSVLVLLRAQVAVACAQEALRAHSKGEDDVRPGDRRFGLLGSRISQFPRDIQRFELTALLLTVNSCELDLGCIGESNPHGPKTPSGSSAQRPWPET